MNPAKQNIASRHGPLVAASSAAADGRMVVFARLGFFGSLSWQMNVRSLRSDHHGAVVMVKLCIKTIGIVPSNIL